MHSHAKKTRRFKIFLCFRPVAATDGSVKPRRDGCVDDGSSGDSALFLYLPEDDSMALRKILTRISEDEVEDCSDKNPGKGGARRRFTRLLKAVFFRVSLAKKVRIKKARKNSEPSMRSKSVSGKTNGTLDSRSSLDWKVSFRATKKGEERRSSNAGLCFLLVLLLVLIVWGKVCAIVFTSSMLLLFPSRRGFTRRRPSLTRRRWTGRGTLIVLDQTRLGSSDKSTPV